MYSMATPPLSSLAVGGGDEEDAGASALDEVTDVQERDLVLVPIVEAIRGLSNTTSLGGGWRAATWQRTPRS
jgi:hypothetical protein